MSRLCSVSRGQLTSCIDVLYTWAAHLINSAPFGAGRWLSAGASFSSGDARAGLRLPALPLASRFCLLLELPLLSLSAGRLSISPVLFLPDTTAAQDLQALKLCRGGMGFDGHSCSLMHRCDTLQALNI